MTLDKQKLIDVMAQAIRNANMPANPNHELCQSHEYIEGSRILANAAFAALQDNLPEITLNLHEDLTLNEEKAKLWDKLKSLGK